MKAETKKFLHSARQAFSVSLVLMVVCGVMFPALLTGFSNLFFPYQAGGSLIEVDGKAVAAEHVGQEFRQNYYMWGRPSAYHYNVYKENEDGTQSYQDGTEFTGIGSGSDNYAPSNPELVKRVEADIADFLKKNPDVKQKDIPADLLTASGSGLDPHISPQAADIQVARIAEASGLSENEVREIVKRNTDGRFLGVFGEETVNVVKVNLEIGIAMGLIEEPASLQ